MLIWTFSENDIIFLVEMCDIDGFLWPPTYSKWLILVVF
jgi:hypothetical protein